ncbi:hypothetical protein [Phenylobacterium sp.]|uniref:hypothetical protein n=1 Tax=Phenylobacterium sp. TaxID=1871053 RepID=UPI002FE10B61
MLRLVIVLAALTLAGCAHNLPVREPANTAADPGLIRAFVDVNGSFFPPDWRAKEVVGERAVRRRHSLLAALDGRPDQVAALRRFEAAYLAQLADAAAERTGRVYVLVLGFNNDEKTAAAQFVAMRGEIALSPQDTVIEFYWDGHDAKAYLDAARIWFWGSASSQVVGSRALRRILDRLGDREVIVVSYSRGASVVLSALSNPDYTEAFTEATRLPFLGEPVESFLAPPPLSARGGPIKAVMLAPAVGRSDFWAPGSTDRSWRYRDFSDRLVSVRYTLNPRDEVLNKFWLGVRGRLNPTDLGADPQVGAELRCRHPRLVGYRVEGRVGHGGADYIRDPSYARMLAESGVPVRRPPPPPPPGHRLTDCRPPAPG